MDSTRRGLSRGLQFGFKGCNLQWWWWLNIPSLHRRPKLRLNSRYFIAKLHILYFIKKHFLFAATNIYTFPTAWTLNWKRFISAIGNAFLKLKCNQIDNYFHVAEVVVVECYQNGFRLCKLDDFKHSLRWSEFRFERLKLRQDWLKLFLEEININFHFPLINSNKQVSKIGVQNERPNGVQKLASNWRPKIVRFHIFSFKSCYIALSIVYLK